MRCSVSPSVLLTFVPRVSNWGGYAIAAALAVLQAEETGSNTPAVFLPTSAFESLLISDMMEKYNIVDGVLGTLAPFVDGLPFESDHRQLIDRLGALAYE